MKLSEYAKRLGIHYNTAYRYFKAGKLNATQTHTGTIIVLETIEKTNVENITIGEIIKDLTFRIEQLEKKK